MTKAEDLVESPGKLLHVTTEMTKITGVVDSIFEGRLFGGWTRQPSQIAAAPVAIEVYYDGLIVDSTPASRHRNDMTTSCGFLCQTVQEIDIQDIVDRRLIIIAKAADGTEQELSVLPKTLENFKWWCQGRQAALAGDDAARQILAGLATSNRPLLKAVQSAVERHRLGENKATIIGSSAISELSMFGLPVGLKSLDGTSVVGREGRMFVLAGTNQLLDQYRQKKEDTAVQTVVNGWLNIFERRRLSVSQAGVGSFVQMIIPEKSSVIPEYFPVEIVTPSALMTEVTRRSLEHLEVSKSFLDAFLVLTQENLRLTGFRFIDSHLSVYGAKALVAKVLELLQLRELQQPISFTRTVYMTADLGAKYAQQPFSEAIYLPSEVEVRALDEALTRVELWEPPSGRHIGTRAVWKNRAAPNPQTIVVFGNSFFERGSSATTLSWWFARLFAEYHFVWDPNLDVDYVKSCGADIVLCQTNERFLSRVPTH